MNQSQSENNIIRAYHVWTFSNLLSVIRPLMLAPFIYYYNRDEKLTAFIIMAVAISTDWFDGRVARWTNTVSDFGKILDPLADKLAIAGVTIFFLIKGELPLWFIAIIVVRDVLIFSGGIYAKRRGNIITTSLPAGKWAVGFISVVLLTIAIPSSSLDLTLIKNISIAISTLLLVVSFIQYTNRFRDLLQGKPIHNL